MPRLRNLQRVLQHSKPPKPIIPHAREIKAPVAVERSAVPDPTAYSKHSQKLYDMFVEDVAANRPHFPIGGKEVYFPWAPITLLRPSARMTPYQAQFVVPLNFNKLDLRDYLWHVYGLRALNITTQVKWSQWHRQGYSRYRTPQVKKMIIDMDQPFIWPEVDTAAEESHQKSTNLTFTKHEEELRDRLGSDSTKPAKAFDGLLGPYPAAPKPYVPKKIKANMANLRDKSSKAVDKKSEEELIRRFTQL
ncbi:54S ribosomal protein L41, mitochondrial [Wickerhamiella sorbophila]|uniref:Large ribosomal subunit protein uL23m n=1 Tax=Wickerhamiella sorbophila TaxID=45607 RepID=A0A2T0FPA8_9ASCO|nr:54S ribosomal protein L41, mitochondrial [Wickerhamiella sorbophila]PRT56824.1 54S ribosomal protein L41, mitochondrial [Wickerhamiella sorbophila]